MIRTCASRRARGFTLVEVMITVTIVGILAMLATVGYRRYVSASKIGEANHVLAGIKTRQDTYKAEVGSYLSVSNALSIGSANHSSLYPLCTTSKTDPGAFKTSWGAACPTACCPTADWKKLGVVTDSPVYYGYSTVAGGPTTQVTAVSLNGNAIAWPNPPGDSWFVATAVADTNGDGTYVTAMISSFDSTIVVENPDD